MSAGSDQHPFRGFDAAYSQAGHSTEVSRCVSFRRLKARDPFEFAPELRKAAKASSRVVCDPDAVIRIDGETSYRSSSAVDAAKAEARTKRLTVQVERSDVRCTRASADVEDAAVEAETTVHSVRSVCARSARFR